MPQPSPLGLLTTLLPSSVAGSPNTSGETCSPLRAALLKGQEAPGPARPSRPPAPIALPKLCPGGNLRRPPPSLPRPGRQQQGPGREARSRPRAPRRQDSRAGGSARVPWHPSTCCAIEAPRGFGSREAGEVGRPRPAQPWRLSPSSALPFLASAAAEPVAAAAPPALPVAPAAAAGPLPPAAATAARAPPAPAAPAAARAPFSCSSPLLLARLFFLPLLLFWFGIAEGGGGEQEEEEEEWVAAGS